MSPEVGEVQKSFDKYEGKVLNIYEVSEGLEELERKYLLLSVIKKSILGKFSKNRSEVLKEFDNKSLYMSARTKKGLDFMAFVRTHRDLSKNPIVVNRDDISSEGIRLSFFASTDLLPHTKDGNVLWAGAFAMPRQQYSRIFPALAENFGKFPTVRDASEWDGTQAVCLTRDRKDVVLRVSFEKNRSVEGNALTDGIEWFNEMG